METLQMPKNQKVMKTKTLVSPMAFHKIIQESNVRCVCGHWVLLDVTITVQISRIQKSLIAVVSGGVGGASTPSHPIWRLKKRWRKEKFSTGEIAIDTPEFEKLTMARVSRRLHTLILFMLKWNLNFAKLLPAINYISPFFPRYLITNCNQKMIQLKWFFTYVYNDYGGNT